MLKKTLGAGLIFCSVLSFTAMSACAYIDPSVITYIMQAILGVAIAGGAAVAIWWKKIKLFFRKRKEKKAENTTAPRVTNAQGTVNKTGTPAQDK